MIELPESVEKMVDDTSAEIKDALMTAFDIEVEDTPLIELLRSMAHYAYTQGCSDMAKLRFEMRKTNPRIRKKVAKKKKK